MKKLACALVILMSVATDRSHAEDRGKPGWRPNPQASPMNPLKYNNFNRTYATPWAGGTAQPGRPASVPAGPGGNWRRYAPAQPRNPEVAAFNQRMLEQAARQRQLSQRFRDQTAGVRHGPARAPAQGQYRQQMKQSVEQVRQDLRTPSFPRGSLLRRGK